MAFITQNDYTMLIAPADLSLVQQSTAANRELAEKTAIAQAESYLSQRYDCKAIWETSGDERDEMLLMVIIDLVLFHLHAHLPGRMGMEIRRQRYEDALAWLKGVANGNITPDLPRPQDENSATPVRYGSQPKNNPYY
jgi:phage gp36-like protein